ncbi:hypothetical protein [Streptomyces monashensis]|uniref:hypothetical protein n=1 Tax=Streptomyces monashensis TaxID=1678012 RepID=UPI0015A616D4|nr:hypothetical protein [Streptomyces monashensis]
MPAAPLRFAHREDNGFDHALSQVRYVAGCGAECRHDERYRRRSAPEFGLHGHS